MTWPICYITGEVQIEPEQIEPWALASLSTDLNDRHSGNAEADCAFVHEREGSGELLTYKRNDP